MVDSTFFMSGDTPVDLWRPERAVRQFEQLWSCDRSRAQIENFVREFDQFARRSLVRSLIETELSLRRRQGETVDKSEYLHRFPDASNDVDEVFSTLRGSPSADPAPTYSVETRDHSSTKADQVVGEAERAGGQGHTGERYVVRHLHASGGLGEVYLAEDVRLHRQVALKQLKHRFAHDRDRHARFLREARITGYLEHPGIVPLHDLGNFPDGRPYYAMRFVHGQSLKGRIRHHHRDEGVDARSRMWELRQLLTRFVGVCQAVEYAHSRGVVHRDLKPSNIMLGGFGETLVVDWGLAKSVDEQGAESRPSAGSAPAARGDAAATESGELLGTPSYMSPEQAAGDLDRVGPASDIYSLGATLFEILTGEPPVVGKPLQIVSQIRAGHIRLARDVRPAVPRPLEAICRRAMAYRAEDRYGSASELAADIEAWLADEPVTAWSEPMRVRASRWVKRHLTWVTGATAAIAATLIASGVALWIVTGKNLELDRSNARISEVNRSLDEANRQLTTTNAQLRDANQLAAANATKAEANYQKAQEVVEQFLTDVSQSRTLLAGTPGTQQLRRTLLDRARQYYEEFLEVNQSDEARVDVAAANRTLGQILYQIGETPRAEQRVTTATSMLRTLAGSDKRARVELAHALNELGKVQFFTSQFGQAQQSYDEAVEALEGIGWDNLGETSRETLAQIYSNRGVLFQELSRTSEAEESYDASTERWRKLLETDPTNEHRRGEMATAQVNYGYLLKTLGLPDRAEATYLMAIESLELLPDVEQGQYAGTLGTALHNLADLYSAQGRFEDAEKLETRALGIRQRLLELNPLVTDYRDAVAGCHKSLALIYTRTGRAAEAEQALQTAVELREKLVREDPAVSEYQDHLASTYSDLALHYRDAGQSDRAESYYMQALDLRQQIAARGISADKQNALASTYHSLGEFYRLLQRWQQSAEMFSKAIDVRQALVDASPENTTFQAALASSLMQYGGPLLELKQNQEAEQAFNRAIDLLHNLAVGDAAREHLTSLAVAYNNLAYYYSRVGQNADAETPLLETKRIYEDLIRQDATVVTYHSGMAACCNNLGAIYWFLKRFDEAEQMLLRGAQAYDALLTANPRSSSYRSELANSYRNLSALFLNQGQPSRRAAEYMAKAVGELTKLVADEPNVPPYRVRLAAALNAVGLAEKRLGNYAGAMERYEEAIRVGAVPAENLQADLDQQVTLAMVRKAWIRATCPDETFRHGELAVQDATAACEKSEWKNAFHLDVLAAALAETGDFDQAVQREEAAVELADETNQPKYRARLEQYRQHEPLRDQLEEPVD